MPNLIDDPPAVKDCLTSPSDRGDVMKSIHGGSLPVGVTGSSHCPRDPLNGAGPPASLHTTRATCTPQWACPDLPVPEMTCGRARHWWQVGAQETKIGGPGLPPPRANMCRAGRIADSICAQPRAASLYCCSHCCALAAFGSAILAPDTCAPCVSATGAGGPPLSRTILQPVRRVPRPVHAERRIPQGRQETVGGYRAALPVLRPGHR